MSFHTHVLSNGLQVIGETSPSARSVAVGFFVRTGARDESAEESGVSHFLEHMMFKGTPRRSALDVNLDFDRIGAQYNAYTSEENTVYYAAVLPEYLPKAVDILADILRPSLRTDDFDTEKKVILEEIEMYEDQPGFVAGDIIRKLHFGPHPLGNSVLGTPASVTALTSDQMRGYFQKRYVAPNITVAVAGNFEWKQFIELVEKSCAGWETGPAVRSHLVPTAGSHEFKLVTKPKEKVQQEYVYAISAGPAADSPLRFAADTLALAIGDDTGSRMYWEFIDTGYADSADMSFYENEANGAFYSSFTCEPELAAENLERLKKVLADVQKNGITQAELQQAKTKITSRVVRSSERPMGRMRAIASAWVYNHEYRDVDQELARYEAVTMDQVQEVLKQFPLDQTTTLVFGPLEELK